MSLPNCTIDVVDSVLANCSCLPWMTHAHAYTEMRNCVEPIGLEETLTWVEFAILVHFIVANLVVLFGVFGCVRFTDIALHIYAMKTQPTDPRHAKTVSTNMSVFLLTNAMLLICIFEKICILVWTRASIGSSLSLLLGFFMQVAMEYYYIQLLEAISKKDMEKTGTDELSFAPIIKYLVLFGCGIAVLVFSGAAIYDVLIESDRSLLTSEVILYFLFAGAMALTLLLLRYLYSTIVILNGALYTNASGNADSLKPPFFVFIHAFVIMCIRVVLLLVLLAALILSPYSNSKSLTIANTSWFISTVLFAQLTNGFSVAKLTREWKDIKSLYKT